MFDITAGVLRRCWDFRARPPRLPESEALAAACALIGWSDVERDNARVRLPRAGMEIDFGGIGKEYAADRAATILRDAGVAHALVDLAGDVRAVGAQADGAPWRVGIRHPRRDGAVIAYVELADGAVATSGDYERFSISTAAATVTFSIRARECPSRTGSRSAWWRLCASSREVARRSQCCRKERGEAFLAAQGLRYVAVGPDGRRVGTSAAA